MLKKNISIIIHFVLNLTALAICFFIGVPLFLSIKSEYQPGPSKTDVLIPDTSGDSIANNKNAKPQTTMPGDMPSSICQHDKICFGSNQVNISIDEKTFLDLFADYMSSKPKMKMTLTVALFSGEWNTEKFDNYMDLSKKRAFAVKSYLVNSGIKAERILPLNIDMKKDKPDTNCVKWGIHQTEEP